MAEEEKQEEKKLRAKPVSLIGQIVAALWVGGYGSFYLIRNIATIDVWDIIVLGLAIAACFSPVYFNLLLDKIKEIRWGNKS